MINKTKAMFDKIKTISDNNPIYSGLIVVIGFLIIICPVMYSVMFYTEIDHHAYNTVKMVTESNYPSVNEIIKDSMQNGYISEYEFKKIISANEIATKNNILLQVNTIKESIK